MTSPRATLRPPTIAPAAPAAPTPDDLTLWSALLLLLVPLFLRASLGGTSLPYWDQDPLVFSMSTPVLGPAGSMLCDAVALLGASILSFWSYRRRLLFHPALILLGLFGAAAVVAHGWLLGPERGSLGDQRIGASWLTAILGALAVWTAAQDPRARRLIAGLLFGFVALLALDGIAQVYVEHAATVADFNADPDRVLMAHGWTKNSPMAKSFIRRLMQPEAIAWFGLANVLATFAAASLILGAALLSRRALARLSQPPSNAASERNHNPNRLLPSLLLLFTLLSAFTLFLAGAKGGYLAAAASFLSLPFFALLSRLHATRPRPATILSGLLGVSAILAPIALVAIRGLIGLRIHELSLLFRSFYAQAAARIFLNNPVVGVGPDDFQRAFTLAKPPLCPEEVSSPHCIAFDWTADLGVLGIAWLILLSRFAWAATTNTLSPAPPATVPPAPPPSRTDTRFLFLVPAVATILAAFYETPYITPDLALVRIGGLILWAATAWAIAAALDTTRAVQIALAASALALLAHAQIDLTGSNPASAPLWLLLIATAAAPISFRVPTLKPGLSPLNSPAFLLLLLPTLALSALLSFTALTRARSWEQHLSAAAATVRPIAEFTERLAAISQPPPPGVIPSDSPERIARDLAKALGPGHDVKPEFASVNAAMSELDRKLLPSATAELESAFAMYPDDRRPLREASRLHLRLADGARNADNAPAETAALDAAARTLRMPLPAPAPSTIVNPSASEWHWLAVVLEHRADLLADQDARREAIQSRLNVAALDPYNLDNAVHLFRDHQRLNNHPEARAWAQRCLELNEFMQLDPEVRALSPEDKADIERSLKAPAP